MKSTKKQRQLIGIGCGRLGIDKETKAGMLMERYGRAHTTEISFQQADDFLNELASKGFSLRTFKRRYPNRPKNMDRGGSRAEQLKKIEALLTIGGKPWNYANSLAARICKCDRIEWVADHDLYKIVTALRKQALREGWDLSGEQGGA